MTYQPNIPDGDWVSPCDPVIFAELTKHRDYLVKVIAASFPRWREYAEDIVQNSFIYIWIRGTKILGEVERSSLVKLAKYVAIWGIRHNNTKTQGGEHEHFSYEMTQEWMDFALGNGFADEFGDRSNGEGGIVAQVMGTACEREEIIARVIIELGDGFERMSDIYEHLDEGERREFLPRDAGPVVDEEKNIKQQISRNLYDLRRKFRRVRDHGRIKVV